MSEEGFWTASGIAWAFLGAAYAAVWLWLGVRLANRRTRWAIWMAAVMVITPVLYVLSSGPMTIVACRRHVTHVPAILPNGTQGVMATSERSFGKWFWITYAPLFWASEQSWGEPVYLYWELFLDREPAEDP
jgi:hypothetical protein